MYLVSGLSNLLNIWKQRQLSLTVKIQVFKSLVASKPVNLANIDAKCMSLKFMWIKQLKDAKFRPWKAVARNLLYSNRRKHNILSKFIPFRYFEQRVSRLPQLYNELVAPCKNFSKCETLSEG